MMGFFDIFKKKQTAAPQPSTDSKQELEEKVQAESAPVEPAAPAPEQPAAEVEQPAAEVEQPAAEVEQPAAEVEQPAAEVEQPAAEVEQSAAEVNQPAAEVEQPAAEAEQPEVEVPEEQPKKKGFFSRFFTREKKATLDRGLEKTKQGLFAKIAHTVAGKSTIDDDVLDNLEEVFITSDVGVDTTLKIIDRVQARVKRDKYMGTSELNNMLCEEITQLLADNNNADMEDFQVPDSMKPYVIMVVGVNGVGKTTTIGKLAHHYKQAGNKVVLGAADTYRAAADEQLEIWGNRVGVPVIKHAMGTDPASVAYDAVASAKAQNADVVIIDTAGRLHNNKNLMNELTKIKNVMQKVLPDAPHEVLLIIDGSTGQNAFEQAKQFVAATEVNALAVTKLDGTAKGGVVIGISDQFQIPVKYIGLGEGIDDLQIFRREEFVKSLFGK